MPMVDNNICLSITSISPPSLTQSARESHAFTAYFGKISVKFYCFRLSIDLHNILQNLMHL